MKLRSPTGHENQTYATACSHLRHTLTPIQPSPVEGEGSDSLLPLETVSQRKNHTNVILSRRRRI